MSEISATRALAVMLGKTPEPPLDRKQERAFRASAPAKDLPCCFPGCKQRFRKSTQYSHFLAHVEQHHRKKIA